MEPVRDGEKGAVAGEEDEEEERLSPATQLHDTALRVGAPRRGPMGKTLENDRSIYMWDYGLWAACSESRYVIDKHYKKNRQLTPDCRPEWRLYHDDYPIFKTIRTANRKTMRVMLQPYKDVFCLGFQDMDTALLRDEDPLGFLFLESAKTAEQEGVSDPDVNLNLAMEFDPTWRRDWPGYPEILGQEESYRGALARLFERTFVNLWQVSIFLIDHSAIVDGEPSQGGVARGVEAHKRPLFRDTKFEYFKIESGSEAIDFLQDLDDLLDPMYDIWTGVEHGQMQDGALIPEVRLGSYVHVLGCREYAKTGSGL
ncbi:hypothetical protein E4U21_006897 [Claviceps maximensis]|nr:hypothetical protein E4U21_006897 [Claviceps maximensis]